MDLGSRQSHGHNQALASDTFDKFCNASSLRDILSLYRQLCSICKLVPARFQDFFPKIRGKIPSWRAEELWSRFEKKGTEKCYARGRYCTDTKVLVLGAGPCGLRAAIEAQLLGAKVVVIEKRETFSRNNVLHLWPFVITDLRSLGAKALYGKFCAGTISHISIRTIQVILLKVALLMGVEFYEGVGFNGLIHPSSSALDDGWRASISPSGHPLAQYQFDVILGADGRRSILSSEGFKRKALRAKLAIAITANFINKHTEAEAKVEEISGVSYIFKQQFFQDLDEALGISLENIVYYKDETHYFVMTPKKQSLLEKGVLYQDFAEPELLLSPENVNQEALQRFTMEAVVFATDNRLPELEFSVRDNGQADVAVFDFTTMYSSENACRAIQRKGHKLLIGLVGDALLEPFWPTGSGCARGFLSSYDAAWMIRSWGKGLNSVLETLAERESIYRLLGQTTPENLAKDHNLYSIDPKTRYPKINLGAVNPKQITYLYDSDVPIANVFDPIRDPNNKALKEFVMPPNFLVRWLQEQLSCKGLRVDNIFHVFNGGHDPLAAVLNRYRPDLIDYPLPIHLDKSVRNQLVFEILRDEFHLHVPMDCDTSVRCGEPEVATLTRYISQVYLRLKGDILRENAFILPPNAFGRIESAAAQTQPQTPNNSKLHHSLSVKEFLRGKEILERNRKEQESNQSKRERRRSQLYDALLQSESQNSLQRSQTSINVVIPVVKLNPVPPAELFAACRQGRDKDVASETRAASLIPTAPSSKHLVRSRSDVGFRRGPSPLAASPVPTSARHLNSSTPSAQEQQNAEVLEMQMKIMKRRTTPAGAVVSTFLQKQAIAASIQNAAEEEQDNWTKRQIRDMRARSLNQNTFNGWVKKPENEQIPPPQQQSLQPDISFRERCKLMEKNIYNSGRDIKVHCSSVPWASEMAPPPSTPHLAGVGTRLQKSPSSPGTTFLAKQHQFTNGNNSQPQSSHLQQFRQQQKIHNNNNIHSKIVRMDSVEKKLGATIAGMKAQLHSPSQYKLNGQIIHPGNPVKNNNSMESRNGGYLTMPQGQQLSRSATSIGVNHHPAQHNNMQPPPRTVTAFMNAKVVTDSSGESDSDLEFLKNVDFASIDGQELQELLSSF